MQSGVVEFHKDGYTISTDKARLDMHTIYDFLSNRSYWAMGRPLAVVERSIQNSLCFGLYDQEKQLGFARVITDLAIFAYLADLFILEDYRGRGLSKWLIDCILSHPDLQNLRVWMLATRDAHSLYAQFGFEPLSRPEWLMEIRKPS